MIRPSFGLWYECNGLDWLPEMNEFNTIYLSSAGLMA